MYLLGYLAAQSKVYLIDKVRTRLMRSRKVLSELAISVCLPSVQTHFQCSALACCPVDQGVQIASPPYSSAQEEPMALGTLG